MDAIPVIGEDPMLRFQFVDVIILSQIDSQPPQLPFPILQSNDVTFGYEKDHILFKDINFGLDFQSRVGILGPNGIGKSTLVKVSYCI